MDYISQYVYREKFGLSWHEFLQEPYRVYLINVLIMQLYANKEQQETNRMKSRAK